MSPASSTQADTPRSQLAETLGAPHERREFQMVHAAAARALALIREGLGEAWLNRYCPQALRAELAEAPAVIVAKRLADRTGAPPLYGAHVTPTYSAFSIPISASMPPGWRVLQALILASLLLHRRDRTRIATHVTTIAQFLTATVSLQARPEGVSRAVYLENLKGLDLREIERATSEYRSNLPKEFISAIARVASALRSSILPIEKFPPKPTKSRRKEIKGPKGPIGFIQIAEPDDENELASGIARSLTRDEVDSSTEAAEAEAEQTSLVVGNIAEPGEQTSIHTRTATARRLFLDVSHGFWTRQQWSALTPAEMRVCVARWTKFADLQLAAGKLAEFEAALLVLLVGCTGWPDERVWSTPILTADAQLPEDYDRAFLWDAGQVVFPVPSGGARYDPERKGHQDQLLRVADNVSLRLPTDVSTRLRAYRQTWPHADQPWLQAPLEQLREIIRGVQSDHRAEEPRETISRIRNGHLLEMLTSSQDLALSQLATGELLGASDVGLTYYAPKGADVQRAYDSACTTHGYTPSAGLPSIDLVGGSKLQVPPQLVHAVAGRLRKGLGQSNARAEVSASEALRIHNAYAPAAALQFCAGTLTRPNDTIGEITIANISLHRRAAVVADKVVDEGHLGRLVALPDMVVETFHAYGRHLFALTQHKGLSEPVRKAARDALEGTGPMFFALRDAKARPLKLSDLRDCLPADWTLPENFLRHRYASLLREHGCPAPFVEAQMGHVEFGAQPFGRESFIDPIVFLRETGRHLEVLLQFDGFKPLYGLASDQDRAWHSRPLGEWVLDLRAKHQAAIDAIREDFRLKLDRYRTDSSQTIDARVSAVLLELVPDFLTARGGVIDKERGLMIRRMVTKNAQSMAQMQVLIERLREVLVTAKTERQWKIARLPYFHPGNVEPTPFAPSYPHAVDSFVALREYFVHVLNGTQKAPRTLTARARLVLALILWHGVCDWPRLDAILRNINRARRVDGLDDAVLVPIPLGDDHNLETTEVLRGVVALAAVPFIGVAIEPPNKRRLSEEIHRSLPSWIVSGDDKKLLDVLFEAAAITHAFEAPAVVRDVWTGAASSVTLPPERISRLFTRQPIGLSAVSGSQPMTESEMALPALPASSAPALRQYRTLRNILRVPKGRPKALPYQGSELPANAPPKQVRTQILSELHTHLAALSAGESAICLLTLYAKKLLERGTPSHSRIELSTVYGYIVGAGACLMRTHAKAALTESESEDLLEIYTDAVECAPRRYRPSVAKYLSYFHGYLVEEHDAQPVDLRGIGGDLAGIPDVGFVTPIEFLLAERFLDDAKNQDVSASIHVNEQSIDVLTLGYATGARSSELILRERRELVADDGRTTLLIRSNRMTGTKTVRSVRPIALGGWMNTADVAQIKIKAEAMSGSAAARAPLFPDSDEMKLPTDPAAITAAIGSALRAATGEAKARLYWLRHTATSMDLLFLFGDPDLLRQIHHERGVPFPFGTAEEFATLLAGSPILCQVHAGAYRGRRGHASIRTAQTSYIHIIGLIRTYASRLADNELQGKGRAILIDRTHAWLRQVLSRAHDASSGETQACAVLLAKCLEPAKPEGPSMLQKRLSCRLPDVKLGDVYRCVQRYFSTGDIESALSLLKVTRAAEQEAGQFLENLRIIPAPAGQTKKRVRQPPQSLVRVAGPASVELRLGPKAFDSELVDAVLKKMRARGKKPGADDAFWQSVLDGADPVNAIVRFKGIEQLKNAVTIFGTIFGDQIASGAVALVVDKNVSDELVRGELLSNPTLASVPIARRKVPVIDGHIAAALAFVTTKQQFRLASLVLLAVCWWLWSKLRNEREGVAVDNGE